MFTHTGQTTTTSERVHFRVAAIRYHLMQQLRGTVAEATTIRDVMICWLAWVAICSEEGFSLHGIAVSALSLSAVPPSRDTYLSGRAHARPVTYSHSQPAPLSAVQRVVRDRLVLR